MSLRRGRSTARSFSGAFLSVLALCLISIPAMAQEDATPKVDIFAGYQWLHPGATVPAPFQPPGAPVAQKMGDIPQGAGASAAYNFTPHWALEADYGGNSNKNGSENTFSIGPRFAVRNEGVMFFAHTLLGYNRLGVPLVDTSNGIGAILGGGMDLSVWKHLSLRVFEADYVWANQHFPDQVSPAFPELRRPSLSGVRLRTGVVFNLGFPTLAVPAASCSLQPSEVMVGEPVTATTSATNFNPKHPLTYNWSSTGGKVTSKDNTATIDTNGVAGGSYTVSAHVTDPKMKKGGEASCTANFSVKEPPKNPPTMSCSANPASVQSGTPSTVTCTCTSPDNVPVTIGGWSATGGSVSGDAGTATLNTSGATPGTIIVTCNVVDDLGKQATATTSVTVTAPPPPPAPQPSSLCSVSFERDRKRPVRVDNEAKGCLDEIALTLNRDSSAKLVIVGKHSADEKPDAAAERTLNVEQYLTEEKGIDPSRIQLRTGGDSGRIVENTLVPAGASFDFGSTATFDASSVKRHGPAYSKPR